MDTKLIIAFLLACNCYSSCGAALRRTPKVYNALITTDENLTSSRAYPVIQPTIHESGIAHYPFGPYAYNPYGFYTPPVVRFGQPIAPGLTPRQQLPYPLPQTQFPPKFMAQPPPFAQPPGYPVYQTPQNPPTAPAEQEPAENAPQQDPQQPQPQPQQPKPPSPNNPFLPNPQTNGENQPHQIPNENSPLPLNPYGYPPSLIPVPHIPNRSLPPYALNQQYPLIFDPATNYREHYLPPYEYFQRPGPGLPTTPKKKQPAHNPAPTPSTPSINNPNPTPPEQDEPTEQTDASYDEETSTTAVPPNFDDIKNNSESKNQNVPDVPPPPVPSRSKSKSKQS